MIQLVTIHVSAFRSPRIPGAAAAIGHASANRAVLATGVAGLAGGAAYIVVLVVLRTPELGALVTIVRRRGASTDA